MKVTQTMRTLLIPCISFFIISLGCGGDPVQPQLTETEKKLTANTWRGAWNSSSFAVTPTLLCEDATFKSDKSCVIKNCDLSATQTWSITDSIGSSYLTIDTIRYLVEKLTTDTLLLKETTSKGKSYLLLKNFTGYNRVKMLRTYENGTHGGTFGLECAENAEPEIPEYNFSAGTFPNPASIGSTLEMTSGMNTSVKITIEDGQSQVETVYDDVLLAGKYSISLDLTNKSNGVYRISYTVKSPNSQTSKTVYSYIYVFK